MGKVFECEIQARLRDINLGGHVDNVEAIRVLDEARLMFFRHGRLEEGDEPRGLLRDLPPGVTELVGSQHVEYHTEMRFAAYQPFLVRIWVSHVSRSSFAVSLELRVAPDHPPAVVAETSTVFWDTAAGSSWPISDTLRAALAAYTGPAVALRPRPGH